MPLSFSHDKVFEVKALTIPVRVQSSRKRKFLSKIEIKVNRHEKILVGFVHTITGVSFKR